MFQNSILRQLLNRRHFNTKLLMLECSLIIEDLHGKDLHLSIT